MSDDRAKALAEALRRGLLSPQQKAAYEQAQKRGLLGGDAPAPSGASAGGDAVFYNEANQPFTMSGKPPPAPAADSGYTGSILPLSRDQSGLHLAMPESIASPARGMETAGKRALGVGEKGQDPLRPLSSDELSAVMAAGPLAAPMSKGATTAAPAAAAGISRERGLLAKEAIDTFGIPLTAAQIGGSQMAKLGESAIRNLPLSGAREHEMKTRQSFNQAVAKTFGEDAKTITQTVMDQAKKRIGGEINRIENNAQVNFDPQLINDLAAVEGQARAGLTDQEFAVVKRLLDGTIQNVTPANTLEGTTYGNLLSRKSPLDQGVANSNPNIARPAQEIKIALQDALQRSLKGADLDDYRAARFEYKNMKTIEPLVKKAPTGDISPALLNSEVSKNFPNRAFDSSGTNALDKLAKIGQAFLKEPPSSGTAERGYTLAKMGELGAAVAAGDVLGVPTALGGAAGTLAAGRAAGAAMRSPRLANRTIEKTLRPPPTSAGFPPASEMLYRSFPGGVLGDEEKKKANMAPADPHGMMP